MSFGCTHVHVHCTCNTSYIDVDVMAYCSSMVCPSFHCFYYDRVFRTMFKENHGIQRVGSPTSNRRRLNSCSTGSVNNSTSTPQLQMRSPKTQPSMQRSKLMSSVVLTKMKKSDSQERATSASPEPKGGPTFVMDEPRNIQEQVPGF